MPKFFQRSKTAASVKLVRDVAASDLARSTSRRVSRGERVSAKYSRGKMFLAAMTTLLALDRTAKAEESRSEWKTTLCVRVTEDIPGFGSYTYPPTGISEREGCCLRPAANQVTFDLGNGTQIIKTLEWGECLASAGFVKEICAIDRTVTSSPLSDCALGEFGVIVGAVSYTFRNSEFPNWGVFSRTIAGVAGPSNYDWCIDYVLRTLSAEATVHGACEKSEKAVDIPRRELTEPANYAGVVVMASMFLGMLCVLAVGSCVDRSAADEEDAAVIPRRRPGSRGRT